MILGDDSHGFIQCTDFNYRWSGDDGSNLQFSDNLSSILGMASKFYKTWTHDGDDEY
jgi:hypothetical protein